MYSGIIICTETEENEEKKSKEKKERKRKEMEKGKENCDLVYLSDETF